MKNFADFSSILQCKYYFALALLEKDIAGSSKGLGITKHLLLYRHFSSLNTMHPILVFSFLLVYYFLNLFSIECFLYLNFQEVGTIYTHHQKTVIVDADAGNNRRKIMAFVGGLDLCDGRYDTPNHPIFRTLQTVHKDDYHNPTYTVIMRPLLIA